MCDKEAEKSIGTDLPDGIIGGNIRAVTSQGMAAFWAVSDSVTAD